MDFPAGLIATVEDFILAYGNIEATELTQIEDTLATTPNIAKIQMALDDAFARICAFDVKAPCPSNRIAVRKMTRRAMLIIARYFLDSTKLRDTVKTQYDDIMDVLEGCLSDSLCKEVDSETLEEFGLDPKKRSFKICAQPRTWNSCTTSEYRNGSYFRGKRTRG